MKIGKTLYVTQRKEWRSWLANNHDKEKEIWLIFYKKSSGKPRIPYNDAVEEALCYGWIDSIVKIFTPRRPKSKLSELNKERIRQLIKQSKMTDFDLAAVEHVFNDSSENTKLTIAPDILKALKQDNETWEKFQNFPESYKRIRIG